MKNELSKFQKKSIKDAFIMIKEEENLEMTNDEFKLLMLALGFEPTQEELEKILGENELSNNITLELAEKALTSCFLKLNPSDEFSKMFKLICGESKAIDLQCLSSIAKDLNESLSNKELEEMLKEGDFDNDGVIGENDFNDLMKKVELF